MGKKSSCPYCGSENCGLTLSSFLNDKPNNITMEKYYLFDLETEQVLLSDQDEPVWRKSIEELRQMLVDEGYAQDAILTKFAPVQLHNF